MMLKEVKEMFECDVVGNDKEYINKLNLTDDDYCNIRRIMESARYNTTETYYNNLCCACAMFVYLSHEYDLDSEEIKHLRDDLEDNIDNHLRVLYDEAYEEYQKIKREKEEDATEISGSDC